MKNNAAYNIRQHYRNTKSLNNYAHKGKKMSNNQILLIDFTPGGLARKRVIELGNGEFHHVKGLHLKYDIH